MQIGEDKENVPLQKHMQDGQQKSMHDAEVNKNSKYDSKESQQDGKIK